MSNEEAEIIFPQLSDTEDEGSNTTADAADGSPTSNSTQHRNNLPPTGAINSVTVGQFLREFSQLPIAEQMESGEHRFLRTEVLRLAKRIGEHREERKLAAQKTRFRRTMEEQRTSTDFLPPSPGVEGLIYLSPSPSPSSPARPQLEAPTPSRPQIASSAINVDGASSGQHGSPSHPPSFEASPVSSHSASSPDGGVVVDPSSTALTVGGAPITLEQLQAQLMPHRRKAGSHKPDPTRAKKPHLANLGGDTQGMNRQQLQDASRTVRQLRHLGAVRCYVCKSSLENDALRHQKFTNHCIVCGGLNDLKRNIVVPLPGRIAVVTGARIKIGYQVGLKLLRCGVTLLATTRFPSNLLLRYSQEPDYSVWSGNLHVLYADLMNPLEVQDLSRRIQQMVPHVDILINNAAQTVRRPKAYHERLNVVEQSSQNRLLSLMSGEERAKVMKQIQQPEASPPPTISPAMASNGPARIAQSAVPSPPSALAGVTEVPKRIAEVAAPRSPLRPATDETHDVSSSPPSSNHAVSIEEEDSSTTTTPTSASSTAAASSDTSTALSSPSTSTTVGLVVGSSSAPSLARAVQVLGAGMLELPKRSYQQFSHIPSADDITPEQAKEFFPEGKVDVTNDHEPLDLRSGNSWNAKADEVDPRELAEVLSTNAMAPFMLTMALKPWLMKSPNKAKYVILVSSMEGKLNRTKEDMHAHTNMAKAALNALTRTVSTEFASKGIYLNSVDTGWNSEERAVNDPQRDPTFETPLDCTDGAARILDPIFEGETKQRYIFGAFLKDFAPTDW